MPLNVSHIKQLIARLFFKRDNSGRLLPTLFTLIFVVVVVFGGYFFFWKDTAAVKQERTVKVSAPIVSREQIIEVSNAEQIQTPQDFSYLNDLLKESAKAKQEPMIRKKSPFSVQTASKLPMLVYDESSNYKSEMITPLGSMIKCILIHTIVTNNFDAPVVAQVWEDFYFNNKLLFPFGTRLYGIAGAGKQRDRVVVKFHTAVFQDGKTISIKGMGLSQNGSGGIEGIVIDDRNKKIIMEMAINFLSAFTLAMEDTYISQVSGGRTVQTTSRNAILEGIAQTLQKEGQRIQDEVMKSEGYAIVLAGSSLIVYLEKEIDVNPIT